MIRSGLFRFFLFIVIISSCVLGSGCGSKGDENNNAKPRSAWNPPTHWEQVVQSAFMFAYDPSLKVGSESIETNEAGEDENSEDSEESGTVTVIATEDETYQTESPIITQTNDKVCDFTLQVLDTYYFTKAYWRFVLFKDLNEDWESFLIIISSNDNPNKSEIDDV